MVTPASVTVRMTASSVGVVATATKSLAAAKTFGRVVVATAEEMEAS